MAKYWSIGEIVKKITGTKKGSYNDFEYGNDRYHNAFKINIDNGNVYIKGQSISSEASVKLMANYAMNNEVNNGCVYAIESSFANSIELTPEERQILIDKNITVVNVYSIEGHSLTKHLQNAEGVHMIDLKMDIRDENGNSVKLNPGHILPNKILNETGITSASRGNIDFSILPTKYVYNGKEYTINYTYTENYTDNSGKYTSRKIDAIQASSIVRGEIPKISSYTDGSSFVATEYDSEVKNHYSGLKQLQNLEINCSGIISNNLSFTVDSMNTMRGRIKDSQFLTSLKGMTFSSTEGIPGSISGNIETYFGFVGTLLEKIKAQSEIVVSAAQAYADMDADMQNGIPEGQIKELPYAIVIPKYNADYFVNKDVREIIYPVTAEDLDSLFKYWSERYKNPNSPLLGTGKYFIEAAATYGIDPLFLVGICGQETGHGGTGGMPRMKYCNFFGTNYVYSSINPNSSDYKKRTIWTSKGISNWKNLAKGDKRYGIMLSVDCITRGYINGEVTGGKTANTPYELDKNGYNGTRGVNPNKKDAYYYQVASVMDQALDYIVDLHKNDEVPVITVDTSEVNLPTYTLNKSAGKWTYTTDYDGTGVLYTPEASINTGVEVNKDSLPVKAANASPIKNGSSVPHSSTPASPSRSTVPHSSTPSYPSRSSSSSPNQSTPNTSSTKTTEVPATSEDIKSQTPSSDITGPANTGSTSGNSYISSSNTSYHNTISNTINNQVLAEDEYVDGVDIIPDDEYLTNNNDGNINSVDNTIPYSNIDNTNSVIDDSSNVSRKNNGSSLKTFATITGLGAAIGAAGYGAYKYMDDVKNRIEEDKKEEKNDSDNQDNESHSDINDNDTNEFGV